MRDGRELERLHRLGVAGGPGGGDCLLADAQLVCRQLETVEARRQPDERGVAVAAGPRR